MALVKQHLIVGTYEEVKDYFNKVRLFVDEISDLHGSEDCFEIPTHTIKDQLDAIQAREFKVGLVFYFRRNVIPPSEVVVQLANEMVWIVNNKNFDAHLQEQMNDIFKHPYNSEFMQRK